MYGLPLPHRVLAGCFITLLLGGGLFSCGARTGLAQPEPCEQAGLTRPCDGDCGAGTQVCESGFWQACATPDAQRPCQNDCGQGLQGCLAGVWGDCKVPLAMRSCQNACGFGQESCADGTWQKCVTPPTARSCANECGSGQEQCTDGAWQACEVPEALRPCESVCGNGNETCRKGAWGKCDAPLPKPPKLKATIRDFLASHPDFEEDISGVDLGIVEPMLGMDDKPIYKGQPRTLTTSGRESFDQWYRDDMRVNQSAPLEVQLQPSAEDPGLFVYDNQAFFPIDGQLQGNEKRPHNYHFTLEASTTFQYVGGEQFSFSGDDDMWVFINSRLAIDLGGLHSSLDASVFLDDVAREFGLVRGEQYPLHFFFAERHTIQSNFTIRTSIAEPGSCD